MTTIWVTFEQEGWHFWAGAPAEIDYLKHRHRHNFHFRFEIEVKHDDRLIEFHWLKQKCRTLLSSGFARSSESRWGLEFQGMSCEALAKWMITAVVSLDLTKGPLWMACEVSEDSECGARVEFRPDSSSH